MRFKVGEEAIFTGMFTKSKCTIMKVYKDRYSVELHNGNPLWHYADDEQLTKINTPIR